MATVKAMLKRHYASKDGTYQLVVRVSHKKSKRYFDTGYNIPENNWDEKNSKVKGDFKDKDKANAKIKSMINTVMAYDLDCEVNKRIFRFDHIFETHEKSDSFIDWMQEECDTYFAKKMTALAEGFEKIIRVLKKWKPCLTFTDLHLNKSNENLEAFMRDKCKNSPNTIQARFAYMRQSYERAMAKGGAPYPNPFKGYKIKGEKKPKEKLTIAELEKLESATFRRPNRLLARDLFLFAYYCRGIRFENVITIKKSDIRNGVVQFQMVKSRKPGYQTVHPKLQAIIDRYKDTEGEYLFPVIKSKVDRKSVSFLDLKKGKGTRINESLGSIMEQLGINKKITMHCARHTFAYLMHQRNTPVSVIQQALGHSKIETTQRYLGELDNSIVDSHTSDLYGSVLRIA